MRMTPTAPPRGFRASCRGTLLCVYWLTAISSGASFAQAQTPQDAAQSAPSGVQKSVGDSQAAASTGAQATTPIPWGVPEPGAIGGASSGGSYALLTRLQEENVLLDQQLKIAQKRKALEALQQQSTAGAGGSSETSSGTSLADLATMTGGDPRVLLVQGRPGAARAMIALPTGGTVVAGLGDLVPQVGTVVSITANAVMVRTPANKVTAVPFWNALENTSSSQTSGGSAIPPPIPSRTPGALVPPQGGRRVLSTTSPDSASAP